MTSPAAGQVSIASGTDRSGAVLGLGLALMAANFFFTPEGQAVGQSILGKQVTKGAPTVKWQDLLMQFVFLFILVLFSRADDEAGNVAFLFILALWVLWILFNVGNWSTFLHSSGQISINPVGEPPATH